MGWRETARGEGEACAKGPDLVKDLAPPKTLKDRDSDTLAGVGEWGRGKMQSGRASGTPSCEAS